MAAAPTTTAPTDPDAPDEHAAPAVAPDTADTGDTAEAPRRRRGRRGPLLALLLVVLAVGGYFGFTYVQDSRRYVSTDDALVDSNLVAVAAPAAGTLVSWRIQTGDPVRAGQVLGVVRVAPTGGVAPLISILAPQDGTILRVDAKQGQVIGAASALAYLADLDGIRITAYIDESEVRRLSAGQPVEVEVDGASGRQFAGVVTEIIPAAASQFALIQSQDRGSGNFTKVTQRLEVHIAFTDETETGGLYPGMNARVKISVG